MTRAEYERVQDTILALISDENGYCATYVQNNPADKKHREMIRDYIVSGLNNALSCLHEQVKRGKITVE